MEVEVDRFVEGLKGEWRILGLYAHKAHLKRHYCADVHKSDWTELRRVTSKLPTNEPKELLLCRNLQSFVHPQMNSKINNLFVTAQPSPWISYDLIIFHSFYYNEREMDNFLYISQLCFSHIYFLLLLHSKKYTNFSRDFNIHTIFTTMSLSTITLNYISTLFTKAFLIS